MCGNCMAKDKQSTYENFRTKPILGNSKIIHGKTSVDNMGGANPSPVNPGKASKKGTKT